MRLRISPAIVIGVGLWSLAPLASGQVRVDEPLEQKIRVDEPFHRGLVQNDLDTTMVTKTTVETNQLTPTTAVHVQNDQGTTMVTKTTIETDQLTATTVGNFPSSTISVDRVDVSATTLDLSPTLDPAAAAAAAAAAAEPVVPIQALLFAGPPGPKDCRGHALLSVPLTKPGTQHTTPQCYNVPGVAQCGNFLGNKVDGCEARLFTEPNCRTFSNVAVFVPEKKAAGGFFRSLEITCGIIGVAPAPLNLPGLKLPPDAQQAFG
ncbi:hypothetical protein F4780DRAFT_7905 [Xylariomycetidae sp. FL0641]|nr:hypothetical protein F4780DRAFT_7905 [Xylariomycetidae sp. FL0641]